MKIIKSSNKIMKIIDCIYYSGGETLEMEIFFNKGMERGGGAGSSLWGSLFVGACLWKQAFSCPAGPGIA